jgi:hypothetical protein
MEKSRFRIQKRAVKPNSPSPTRRKAPEILIFWKDVLIRVLGGAMVSAKFLAWWRSRLALQEQRDVSGSGGM